MTATATRLRLYTDFICPFCFVAESSTVPRLVREYDVVLDWRGFPLHPRTPKGGMPLTALFPAARIPAVKEQLRMFAAHFGVTGIVHPEWMPNSRRALAMAEHAREQGRLEPFRHAAFEAHWRGGNGLETDADLGAVAAAAGLDVSAALVAADETRFNMLVGDRIAEAAADGVTGVPTFMIGDEVVVGCQPYEALADAARRAGAKRRA